MLDIQSRNSRTGDPSVSNSHERVQRVSAGYSFFLGEWNQYRTARVGLKVSAGTPKISASTQRLHYFSLLLFVTLLRKYGEPFFSIPRRSFSCRYLHWDLGAFGGQGGSRLFIITTLTRRSSASQRGP